MDDLIYGGEAELQHAKQALAHAPVIISELEMDRLCYPQKILCVGLNYRSHAAETEKEAPSSHFVQQIYKCPECQRHAGTASTGFETIRLRG